MNDFNSYNEDNRQGSSKRGVIIAAAVCLGLILVGIFLSVNAYNKNVEKNNARVLSAAQSKTEKPVTIPRTTYEIVPFNSEAYKEQAEAGKELPQSYYTSSSYLSSMVSQSAAEVMNVYEEEPLTFMSPLSGEVLNSFSLDALVFSNTLGDWRTHTGADFKGEAGDPVCAVANGVVESFSYNEFYGNVLTLSHENGFESRYCGLNDVIFFNEGDEVSQGDVIGTVSGDIPLEGAEQCHIHLEILQDGNYLDPSELIN